MTDQVKASSAQPQNSAPQSLSPPPPPILTVALFGAVAMATVGAVAGGMVGLSQSPVVSDALPLVFGLIAGGGGFALATMDVSSAARRAQLRAASLGVFAFAAAFGGALLWGVETRTERRLAAISDLTPAAQSTFATKGAHEQARIWLARARLAELGAAREEQAATLSRALTQPPPPLPDNRCAAMEPHLETLVMSLSANPLSPPQSEAEEAERNHIGGLTVELSGLRPLVAICAESENTALDQTLASSVGEALTRAVLDRASASSEDSPYTALAMYPGAADAFARLHAAVVTKSTSEGGGLPSLNADWTVSETLQGFGTPGRSLASIN